MRQTKITYLRHPNGHGKLLDDSDVSRAAFLSEDSIAAGSCEIRGGIIHSASKIVGDVKIFGGNIQRSFIDGHSIIAGSPYIRNSVVINGNIAGNTTVDCGIVKDFGRVYDSAIIIGNSLGEPIIIEGSARVYGTAVLKGSFTLTGKMRVCDGVWTRAPRYVDLGFESVTESKLGAMVGCRNRSIAYWLKHGPELAKRWDMTDEQIAQLIEAVKEVSREST